MQNGSGQSGLDMPQCELQLVYGNSFVNGGWAAKLAHRLCRKPPIDEDIMIPLAGNIVFVGYLFAKDLFAFL